MICFEKYLFNNSKFPTQHKFLALNTYLSSFFNKLDDKIYIKDLLSRVDAMELKQYIPEYVFIFRLKMFQSVRHLGTAIVRNQNYSNYL